MTEDDVYGSTIPMIISKIHQLLTYCIAAVWVVNGLFCKVLNVVPRHRQIVAGILGQQYATQLTLAIGLAEIGMAIWIVSGIYRRLNVWTQIIIIIVMNVIEVILVPQMLLWGRLNVFFALMLVMIIYWNEFAQGKKLPNRN